VALREVRWRPVPGGVMPAEVVAGVTVLLPLDAAP
jgi:hypothetical protein